jgi:hypothetical protein
LAVTVRAPIQLSIVPVSRIRAGFSFLDNFFYLVGPIITGGFQIQNLTVPPSKKYLTTELKQEFEDVIVSEHETKNVTIDLTIHAFERALKDYVIFVEYPSMTGVRDEQVEKDRKTLDILVQSFCQIKDHRLGEKR